MLSHTPAPWYDDGYRIHAPTESEDKRAGRVIVEYKHIDDFNYADARLIAVAPLLLEALERLCEAYEARMHDEENADWHDEYVQARAVIAKAKGGQQ